MRNKGKTSKQGIETDERGRNIQRQWGERKQKGRDGNSLKINRQKCFIKSALMQSIHSKKCSCTATAAPLRQAVWFYTLCFPFPADDVLSLISSFIYNTPFRSVGWTRRKCVLQTARFRGLVTVEISACCSAHLPLPSSCSRPGEPSDLCCIAICSD